MKKLKEYIDESNYIVFFGGAGVSTESGVPDFRSVDGIYNQEWRYPPEKIISYTFFKKNTAEFFDFYRKKLLHLDVLPNKAHKALAKLEDSGKLKAVITQNIDGLHQKAGSKNVLELHGSIWRNFCLNCNKSYSAEEIQKSKDIPICHCNSVIKPDIILFEESLDDQIMSESLYHISKADMLIIGGTSLGVYPAAGLLQAFGGKKLVLINKTATHFDGKADLIIRDSIGEAMSFLI